MRNSILILLILFSSTVNSQLNFFFLPEINGKNIDGLGVFKIQNLTGRILVGNVFVIVKENSSRNNIVSIKTQEINISTGIFNFPTTSFMNSQLQFSENVFSQIVSQTRTFPSGEYNICYRFLPKDKASNDIYEDCFDSNVQPIVPISLLNPSDKDSICQKRPTLIWQPPLPYRSGTRYRLLLTEKKQGVENIENLLINVPLLYLDNISSASINYPTSSPELKEGKTYCWQVIAFENGIISSKSEIWEFTIQCTEKNFPKPNDSYRELKSLVNGNYYVANRYIKFSFLNNYNIKTLKYSIHDLDNSQKPIKNVPPVNMELGHNKFDIDISDLGLISGKYYLLRVYPFGEPIIEIRFLYQENNAADNGN